MNEILLLGGGGHGKVVAEALLSCGYFIKGIFDNRKTGNLYNIPFLGPYDREIYPDIPIIISIGDNATRAKLAGQIFHMPACLVHTSAVVAGCATIEQGSMILHKAIIQAGSKIGMHVILNTGAQIDHDCCIESYAHIAPGAVLCGNVRVGEGALVGAGSVLLPGVSVGSWSVIGAGSVITHDVSDFTVVAGNPARVIKTVTHEK